MKISKEDAKAYLDRNKDLLQEMMEYKKSGSLQPPEEESEDGPDLIGMYHRLKTYELEKKHNMLRKTSNNPSGQLPE